MNFHNLYKQDSPLILCNVWDVRSAKIAKKLNFKAIGTSSSAIAAMLGYNDGEEISFAELSYFVKRIRACVDLPLTVDLEAGYGKSAFEIAKNIATLIEIGVTGINIEDSVVCDKRRIIDSTQFSNSLQAVFQNLGKQKKDIFINVRTDTFLLGLKHAANETIERAKKYKLAGANGLFVPCIEKEADIEKVTSSIELPLNVMCMPKLPCFKTLKNFGVKRISMGGFVFNKLSKHYENELVDIDTAQSFKSLFA